jgi:hypothetical protein
MPMTKVQIAYDLSRKLTDEDAEKLAKVQSVYGIFAVRVPASMDRLDVEFDASRLTEKDIQILLAQFGFPFVPR